MTTTIKDYKIRHDITIKAGAEIVVSKNKEAQLIEAGILAGKNKKKKTEKTTEK